jgi:hypothetical protein
MIPRVDSELSEWVGRVLPGVSVLAEVPATSVQPPCVNLYLYRLASAPALQQARGSNPAVTLRYLVTVHGSDSEETHRMLGSLLFDALQHPHYVVDLDAATEDFWQAFGLSPRPAFVLTAPLRLERVDETPRVRHYPRVSTVPAVALHGVLLGPGDIPIANARIVLADLDRYTRTDGEGRFRFAAVPPEPARKRLRIAARDIETEVQADLDPTGSGRPVTIRLTQLES